MRSRPALALSVVSLLLSPTLPACAQRGGGGHGGAGGGHAGAGGGHAGGGFSGGVSSARGGGYAGTHLAPRTGSGPQRYSGQFSRYGGQHAGFASQRFGPRAGYAPAASSFARGRAGLSGINPIRPSFYSRTGGNLAGAGGGGRGNYSRIGYPRFPYAHFGPSYPGYGRGYGVGYGYGFPLFNPFLGAFLDWPIDSSWNDSNFLYNNDASVADAESYDPGQPPDTYAGPAPLYQQGYPQPGAAPYAGAPLAPQAPAQEEAVTLIYKDGRPSEQIRNYALTRTALYIPGPHVREIPLSQLDLAATEQVNRDAGVDFRLPKTP